jgi:hypothetical protein
MTTLIAIFAAANVLVILFAGLRYSLRTYAMKQHWKALDERQALEAPAGELVPRTPTAAVDR